MTMSVELVLDLRSAEGIIRSGGVVIIPTETFYALAADPFQEHAVERIFLIKSRPLSMPVPLIASHRDLVEKMVAGTNFIAHALMDHFWPGSLTLVLDLELPFSKYVRGPSGKVGVRVPPDCAARRLAELAGGWITATSANLSRGKSPDRVNHIPSAVLDAVDLVLDLGLLPGGRPSTLVEPLEDGWRLIRDGAVRTEAIEKRLATSAK